MGPGTDILALSTQTHTHIKQNEHQLKCRISQKYTRHDREAEEVDG